MKRFFYNFGILWMVLIAIFLFIAPAFAKSAKTSASAGKNERKLYNRIDFGNSHILGQSIKSGAVYLLQRKKSDIKSMLEYRKDYRKEILEDFHIIEQGKEDQNK